MADQIKDNLISRSDAQALILAHDGDCALLHLWIALTGRRDYEQAARDLCMTRAQIDTAAEKLARMLTLPAQTVNGNAGNHFKKRKKSSLCQSAHDPPF